MRNQYIQQICRWLILTWVMSIAVRSWAQPVPPTTIQWQRVVEGTDTTTAPGVGAVQASTSGYAFLAGKNLIRLSATGTVIWNKEIPGAYRDSASGYVPVRKSIAVAATPDSGFVVLAQDMFNRYYVAKLNAAGAMAWVKTVGDANTGPSIRLTADALIASPDGSFLVVGTFTAGPTYLALTKLSKAGYITGEWRIKYEVAGQSGTPVIHSGLTTPNGGYLLVGRVVGDITTGLALQLDKQNALTWQRTYPTLKALSDVVVNPSAAGTYTAVGLGVAGGGQAITVAPNRPEDGTSLVTFGEAVGSIALANDPTGTLTALYGIADRQGDFRLINVTRQGAVNWVKSFGGSGSDRPTALVVTPDGGYLALGTTTSTDGDVAGKSTDTPAPWLVKVGSSALTTSLTLQAPTYNCQTGSIAFITTGGDGSPITYNAPGIVRAKLTDNVGTIEPGLRADPKVITIQATQSGKTVSYAFDLAAACPVTKPASESASTAMLQLIAPTYNCRTGALTFHTTGGDESPVEYFATGITNWTTNPNQVVEPGIRNAYDIEPITLMARQNGKVTTYRFDLKAVCGRARIGADEAASGLTVSVLGNPAREALTVEVTGVQGQSMLMRLIDSRGALVENRAIGQAQATEQHTFDLRQQSPGVFLLHTTSNGQTRTVKVLKQ